MTAPAAPETQLRLATLPRNAPFELDLSFDEIATRRVAQALGLLDLRKARLRGQLNPVGRRDWDLAAEIGATATQACVITLAPVRTRIEEPFTRQFRAGGAPEPETGETEMPDDAIAPLPETLDLLSEFTEALALALPAYPRAEGAELAQTTVTAPGITPMSDADTHPFAALQQLRDTPSSKDE